MSEALKSHILNSTRKSRKGENGARFLGQLALARARVHEICGPARRTLALTIAGGFQGHIFWIQPAWSPEQPYGPTVARWIDPGRITFLSPRRGEDLLWSMEEILRSGAVPLVVVDLPEPPALTPVRRLHLAAETGAAEGMEPLGLILTPGQGGAPGVESRWSFAPRHEAGGRTAWQLERLRARSDPPARWSVTPAATGGLALGPAPVITEK